MIGPDFKIQRPSKSAEERILRLKNRFSRAHIKQQEITNVALIDNDRISHSDPSNLDSTLSTSVPKESFQSIEIPSNPVPTALIPTTDITPKESTIVAAEESSSNSPIKNINIDFSKPKSILKESTISTIELDDSLFTESQIRFERAQKALVSREFSEPQVINTSLSIIPSNQSISDQQKRKQENFLEARILKNYNAFKKRKNMTLMPNSSSLSESSSSSFKDTSTRRRSTFGQRAIPHQEIETKLLYRHISPEVPEPLRLRQLLSWIVKRTPVPEIPTEIEVNKNLCDLARQGDFFPSIFDILDSFFYT
ncbi:hypothetical protein AYI68_g2807 [Smittium mucronatum]|uniref:Uncharacterized protein n=1 Tax=Smittium mucronatum TaxID=133383 RepID=A0A1R0H1Q0_9FUNG|nr:hypothetical protein AYI68_g2807 [Smittium mucronatum]